MNDTTVASAVPADARFAFNGILTSKRVCQEFLRDFGVKRDWKNTSLADMQAMLRKVGHQKMFQAAQRLCERSGDEFIAQLFMVGPRDAEEDSAGAEAVPDVPEAPKVPDVPKAKAPDVPDVPEVGEAPDVELRDVRDMPEVPRPERKAKPAKPAGEETTLAAALAQIKAQVTADVRTHLGGELRQSLSQHHAALSTLVDKAVEKAAAKLVPPPRELVIKTPTSRVKLDGVQHKEFDKLIKSCAATLPDGHRLNIWLYGPPGTGKTTAARTAAKALGLPFATTGSLLTKYDITGFITAVGKLVRSPFRDIWEKGGVFLLDEIDGSDPRAIVAFNAALANAVMAFPDKMVERHKDCVMIAAANTSGMGATADFNGRVKLDQASMDRFVLLAWPIDEAIEQACATDAAWLSTVRRVRANVEAKGVKGICISPRATFYGCALLETGLPLATVKDMVLKKGMSAEQWQMVQ